MSYYGIPWLDRFLGTPLEARALAVFEQRQKIEQAAHDAEDRLSMPYAQAGPADAGEKARREGERLAAQTRLAEMMAELTALSQGLEDEYVAYRQEQAYAPDWQAMSKGLSDLDEYVIDEQLSKALESGDIDGALELIKGAGHKYIRRIPTGDPKRKWIYIYNVTSKHHGKGPKVGEKIKVAHGEQRGHYEVTQTHDDDHVTLRHDETGHEMKVHQDHVHEIFAQEHEAEVDAAHKRLARTVEAAMRHGTEAQQKKAKAALEEHREKYGYGEEREDKPLPKEKPAEEKRPSEVEKERAEAYAEFGGQGKFASRQLERAGDWFNEAQKKAHDAKEYADAARAVRDAEAKIRALKDQVDGLRDKANDKIVSLMGSMVERLAKDRGGYERLGEGQKPTKEKEKAPAEKEGPRQETPNWWARDFREAFEIALDREKYRLFGKTPEQQLTALRARVEKIQEKIAELGDTKGEVRAIQDLARDLKRHLDSAQSEIKGLQRVEAKRAKEAEAAKPQKLKGKPTAKTLDAAAPGTRITWENAIGDRSFAVKQADGSWRATHGQTSPLTGDKPPTEKTAATGEDLRSQMLGGSDYTMEAGKGEPSEPEKAPAAEPEKAPSKAESPYIEGLTPDQAGVALDNLRMSKLSGMHALAVESALKFGRKDLQALVQYYTDKADKGDPHASDSLYRYLQAQTLQSDKLREGSALRNMAMAYQKHSRWDFEELPDGAETDETPYVLQEAREFVARQKAAKEKPPEPPKKMPKEPKPKPPAPHGKSEGWEGTAARGFGETPHDERYVRDDGAVIDIRSKWDGYGNEKRWIRAWEPGDKKWTRSSMLTHDYEFNQFFRQRLGKGWDRYSKRWGKEGGPETAPAPAAKEAPAAEPPPTVAPPAAGGPELGSSHEHLGGHGGTVHPQEKRIKDAGKYVRRDASEKLRLPSITVFSEPIEVEGPGGSKWASDGHFMVKHDLLDEGTRKAATTEPRKMGSEAFKKVLSNVDTSIAYHYTGIGASPDAAKTSRRRGVGEAGELHRSMLYRSADGTHSVLVDASYSPPTTLYGGANAGDEGSAPLVDSTGEPSYAVMPLKSKREYREAMHRAGTGGPPAAVANVSETADHSHVVIDGVTHEIGTEKGYYSQKEGFRKTGEHELHAPDGSEKLMRDAKGGGVEVSSDGGQTWAKKDVRPKLATVATPLDEIKPAKERKIKEPKGEAELRENHHKYMASRLHDNKGQASLGKLGSAWKDNVHRIEEGGKAFYTNGHMIISEKHLTPAQKKKLDSFHENKSRGSRFYETQLSYRNLEQVGAGDYPIEYHYVGPHPEDTDLIAGGGKVASRRAVYRSPDGEHVAVVDADYSPSRVLYGRGNEPGSGARKSRPTLAPLVASIGSPLDYVVMPIGGTESTEEVKAIADKLHAEGAAMRKSLCGLAALTDYLGGDASLDPETLEAMEKADMEIEQQSLPFMMKADDGKPGESLAETSTDELEQTHADIQHRLKGSKDPGLQARAKAIAGELAKRKGGDTMEKAGPYVGPKGGKYADPQHKTPWQEGKEGKGKNRVPHEYGTMDEHTKDLGGGKQAVIRAIHQQKKGDSYHVRVEHKETGKPVGRGAQHDVHLADHGGDHKAALEAAKAKHAELVQRHGGGEKMSKGLDGLQDYLIKAGELAPTKDPNGLPKHDEKKLGHGKSSSVGASADGGDLDGVGMTSGSGDSAPAPGTGKDGMPTGATTKKEKWSEDDAEVEKQFSDHKKALESRLTRKSLTPADIRGTVEHEHARKVSELRKGEPDVRVGGTVHPYSHEAVHGNTDAAVERLCKSEFYQGPPPQLAPPGSVLRQSVLCKSEACGQRFAAALTACPHCGEDTVQSRMLPNAGHLGATGGRAVILEKSDQPLLRPPPQEPDLYIPGDK